MVGALGAALVAARVALAPRLVAAARLLVALRLACALHTMPCPLTAEVLRTISRIET